jgi:hypothetical protein
LSANVLRSKGSMLGTTLGGLGGVAAAGSNAVGSYQAAAAGSMLSTWSPGSPSHLPLPLVSDNKVS